MCQWRLEAAQHMGRQINIAMPSEGSLIFCTASHSLLSRSLVIPAFLIISCVINSSAQLPFSHSSPISRRWFSPSLEGESLGVRLTTAH